MRVDNPRGDVFTEGVIDAWIAYKMDKEVKPMALRPRPYEFGFYYDVQVDFGDRRTACREFRLSCTISSLCGRPAVTV
jgi:hypothetical protein